MIVVGLVSSYLAGPLLQGAVRSLLPCCDRIIVFEGPAGDPHPDAAHLPPSEYEPDPRVQWREGVWRTDAHKRTKLLEAAHGLRRQGESLWAVVLDDDEILFGGEYLRDWLRVLDWTEPDPGRVLDDGAEPYYHGRPMRLLELDGSTSWLRGRLIRADRLRRYIVSTSVFETTDGIRYQGGGNVEDRWSEWREPRQAYFDEDRLVVRPPLPTEPYVLHRSFLRHPLRAPLRMHAQEAQELRKAGIGEP